MYAEHMPKIAATMRGDVEGFKRGVLFVICSIRQKVLNVPSQLEEIDEKGIHAECLFGHKVQAFQYLQANAETLWRDLCAHDLSDPAGAIVRLCDMPGMGVVKSAFICQLMGFNVACIDSRNAAREGRNPRAYETRGTKGKNAGKKSNGAFRRMVARYVAETAGHAERYWDEWCADVATAYKRTAMEISELHLAICDPRQFSLEETF